MLREHYQKSLDGNNARKVELNTEIPQYSTAEKKLLLAVAIPNFPKWLEEGLEEYNGQLYIRRVDIEELIQIPNEERLSSTQKDKFTDNFLARRWRDWESSFKKLVHLKNYHGNPIALYEDTMIEFLYHVLDTNPNYISHNEEALSNAKKYIHQIGLQQNHDEELHNLEVALASSLEKLEKEKAATQKNKMIFDKLQADLLELHQENAALKSDLELGKAKTQKDEISNGHKKTVNSPHTNTPKQEISPYSNPTLSDGLNLRIKSTSSEEERIEITATERRVFDLYRDGYSFEHIAKQLSMTENQVGNLYQSYETKKRIATIGY